MTDDERQQVIALLDERITETRKHITELQESAAPVKPDVSLGRLTRLDQMQSQNVSKAALESARNTLRKLERQRKQVTAPTFGKCMMCRNDIPVERLMAVPESPLCVRCAGG